MTNCIQEGRVFEAVNIVSKQVMKTVSRNNSLIAKMKVSKNFEDFFVPNYYYVGSIVYACIPRDLYAEQTACLFHEMHGHLCYFTELPEATAAVNDHKHVFSFVLSNRTT